MRSLRSAGRTLLLLGVVACADDAGAPVDPMTPPGPDEPDVGFVVSAVTPAPSATSVDVRAPVVVTFSAELDSASVPGGLTVTSGDRTVRGLLALDGPTALRFEPSTPLDPGEDVQVTLASSVRSGLGTSLDSAVHWTFRTAGAPLGEADVGRLATLVSVLADDSLRGRGSGTGDETRAAEVIAGDLEASGLVPLDEAWLRSFTAATRETPPVTLGSQNVLGVVPGAGDLADEWVVVGAHYDHLGFVVRADGSLSVYHGADDNASGTSVVLELARLWATGVTEEAGRGRRSVLFALWGAEERGLLGSCSFVASEVLPPEQIAAVFNFDMVGRLQDDPLRVPVAEPDSTWWGMLSDANRAAVPLDHRPGCTACSDHGCFLDAGRPVVWFYTGGHDDYHKPTDVAEKVDYDGLARITGLALRTLWRAAVLGG